MKLPPNDDLMLFGSLAGFAIGAAVMAATTTDDWVLGGGVALLIFGIGSFLVTFMAAGEPE